MALFFLPERSGLLWASFILDGYGATVTESEICITFLRVCHRKG